MYIYIYLVRGCLCGNWKSSFLPPLMLGKCYIQLVIADVSVMQILQTVYMRL